MRLNQNPLIDIPFPDFSGGYAGAKGAGTLKLNEAQDLDNIVVLPAGSGFRNRQGNTEVARTGNLSAVTTPYQGLHSFKTSSNEYLIGIRGSGSDTIVETYTIGDSTSWATQYTYTAAAGSANAIFTMDRFKNLLIGVGDQVAPFKIDFSSGSPASGAALSGSPPSGKVLIVWNNVAWIGNTSSNPSKLYYSALNTPTDWSGAGSGFVEPNPGDGDELIAICPIGNNSMLYFKKFNIYQVVGRADPFAVFPLFPDTGAIGKHAVINVDGLVYFINYHGHMQITDGNTILDDKQVPTLNFARDLWANIPSTRLPYIQAVHQKGKDYDWIVWNVSYGTSQSTNNYAIIWDLVNKCWLKCSKGYNGNVFAVASDGTAYMGGYAGRVYKLDVASKFTDASETAPAIDGSNNQSIPTNLVPFTWFWRTDDLSLASLENVVNVSRIDTLVKYTGNDYLNFSYGYDGSHDTTVTAVPVIQSTFTLGSGNNILGTSILGTTRYTVKTVRPLGRGQFFNLKLSGSTSIGAQVTKFTLTGSQKATKTIEVR